MKKRILTLSLAVIIAVMAITGVSLAYLKDTDAKKNTMTIGNVAIEQIEQQRGDDGLENYVNGKLLPAVYDELAYDEDAIEVNGVKYDGMDAANVVDKIVTVKNTGSEDAYIRTILAFENTKGNSGYGWDGVAAKIHAVYNGANGDWVLGYDIDAKTLDYVEIDGVGYSIVVYTYDEAYAKDEITPPSLLQVFWDKTATNEDLASVSETYDVLVLSQAVQAAGFSDTNENGTAADDALNAAFGEVTAENVVDWFSEE